MNATAENIMEYPNHTIVKDVYEKALGEME